MEEESEGKEPPETNIDRRPPKEIERQEQAGEIGQAGQEGSSSEGSGKDGAGASERQRRWLEDFEET